MATPRSSPVPRSPQPPWSSSPLACRSSTASNLHHFRSEKGGIRMAASFAAVFMSAFCLLWMWSKPVDFFAPSARLLLLLVQCVSLASSILYLWQIIVFHLSYCSVPAARSSSVASSVFPVQFTGEGASSVPGRRASSIAVVGASTASFPKPAPDATIASGSSLAGAPVRTRGLNGVARGFILPFPVEAACGRVASRIKSSSFFRSFLPVWTALRGVAAPTVEGSHVLITGGSKGIGLALAIECVRRGATLVTLVARTASDLQLAQTRCLAEAEAYGQHLAVQILEIDVADVDTVQEQLRRAMQLQGKVAYSGKASFRSITAALSAGPPQPESHHDVRASASPAEQEEKEAARATTCLATPMTLSTAEDKDQEAAEETERPVFPVGVLFCNAAVTLPKTLEKMSSAAVQRMVDVNLTSIMLHVQTVLPYMRQQQSGCICFSNTLAATVPIYGFSVYAATKAALAAFSTGLEQETAGTNIRFVNAYMPSVATPGFIEEKRVRPTLTGRLEGTVSVLPADVVAVRILNAIKEGKRQVTFGVDGWLLARCTAAFNAADSFTDFISEVFFAGLFRACLLGYRIAYQLVCYRHAVEGNETYKAQQTSENAS